MPKPLAKTNGYNTLVKNIQAELSDLDFFVRRRTAEAYWKVGKFIDQHLLENKERADYRSSLLARLADDVDRDESTLNRALKFYRLYPIPAERQELNWNHYKSLITIKDEGERKKLEEQIIEKNWDAQKLQDYLRIKNRLALKKDPHAPIPQLSFTRGKLWTYSVVEDENSGFLLDLGFRVRKDFLEGKSLRLTKDDCLQLEGNNSFTKVTAKKEELFTYQAKIQKIIDGDTLTVLIDLGLGLFVEQKLRLRGIDCPEIDTEEGAKAKKFVQNHLKDLDFIIIKTHKDTSDKYDRYLADIFYLPQEPNPLIVAQEGNYLNQELLNERLACLYKI